MATVTTRINHRIWACLFGTALAGCGANGGPASFANAVVNAKQIAPLGTTVHFHEFAVPSAGAGPYGLVAAPLNNHLATLGPWFVLSLVPNLVKFNSLDNRLFEFPIHKPYAHPMPTELTLISSNNDFWFSEPGSNSIGRFTKPLSGGAMAIFYRPPTAGSEPVGITVGPDGNVWFTEFAADQIGVVTTAGVITEYHIPTPNSGPHDIVVGSDGELWFTEFSASQIGRITTAGAITEYPVTTPGSGPQGITVGSDGALWFTEYAANKIGRMSTAGAMLAEYSIPTANSGPSGIATAYFKPYVFFTESLANQIGRVNQNGVFSEFAVPTPNSDPIAITTSYFHNVMWFTEYRGDKLGNIDY